jgi:hypothetical protein
MTISRLQCRPYSECCPAYPNHGIIKAIDLATGIGEAFAKFGVNRSRRREKGIGLADVQPEP